jgi:PIN domain nuclease of toxin-antitoxin system
VSYLLDTHVWLWMLANPERIRADLLTELRDGRERVLLSAASAWEIAIKWALGRLPLPQPPATYVVTRMERSGVEGLPVAHEHALRVATLPPHHGDPFDRLLIAQAQIESATIVTADPAFDAYDVPIARAEQGPKSGR